MSLLWIQQILSLRQKKELSNKNKAWISYFEKEPCTVFTNYLTSFSSRTQTVSCLLTLPRQNEKGNNMCNFHNLQSVEYSVIAQKLQSAFISTRGQQMHKWLICLILTHTHFYLPKLADNFACETKQPRLGLMIIVCKMCNKSNSDISAK